MVHRRRNNRLVAVLALALLPGCVSGGTPVASAAPPPEKLTIAISSDGDTLDVLGTFAGFTTSLIGPNIAETLAYWDIKSDKFQPLLATTWQQTDDLHWRVQLRGGVKFTSGRDMTSDDAAASINWGISQKSAFWQSFYPTAKQARVIDALTIEIETATPDPLFYRRLAYLSVLPKETLTTNFLATQLVGTGPYKLTAWNRGQNVLLERNDGYWGQKPLFKTAEFVIRPEASVRANATKVGEVHLALQLTPELVSAVPQLIKVPGNEVAGFLLNTVGQKPGGSILQDKRVRQAINYAIDRQTIIDTVYDHLAVLPHGQYNVLSTTGTDPALKDYAYDVAKAKALLKEARADGAEVVLGAPTGRWTKSNELTQAVAGYLTAIGLKVKLDTMEFAQWVVQAQALGKGTQVSHDIRLTHHDNQFFESSMKTFVNFRSLAAGGGQWMVSSPEIDRLTTAITPEKDPAKRLSMERQVWGIIHDEAYTMVVAVPEVLSGANKQLKWEQRADGILYVAQIGWN
jgi:peptide/nickel transport system substrate-binding protein